MTYNPGGGYDEKSRPRGSDVTPVTQLSQPPMREVIAAALANARAGRRGAPPIVNVLEMVRGAGQKIYDDLMDDADAVLAALAPPVEEKQVAPEELDRVERVNLDDDAPGGIDEVVAHGWIHVERMSERHVWANLAGHSFDFSVAKNGDLHWAAQVPELLKADSPASPAVPEDAERLREQIQLEIQAYREAAQDERGADAVREHPNSCGAGMAVGAAEAYEECARRLRDLLDRVRKAAQ